jgi:hypothetical protein
VLKATQAGARPTGLPGAAGGAAPRPAGALAALLGAMFLGNVDVGQAFDVTALILSVPR